MNITHLRTLLAVRKTGSLSGAAAAVHLSHSAVSVQMKLLEAEIGADLFIKGKRPTILTPLGEVIALEAQEIVRRTENLRALTQADDVAGQVRLGFVPTTLETLLPVVLERLRRQFPELQVFVRSGLSERLASDIDAGALDFAFLSAPTMTRTPVQLFEIGTERLFLITAHTNKSDPQLQQILDENTYIAFNRDTRLGGDIAEFLARQGLGGDPAIELDSIDAIENLVARGFGVSVVPQRLLAPPLETNLRCIPLSSPAPIRRLMLAASPYCRRKTLRKTLARIAS
ncbi:MAG: LysR family transcriptional regulator [Rhodobacteraceae bacterium]|nr:LysR family transcriptional regulator [Paracoccaceae bacterium]